MEQLIKCIKSIDHNHIFHRNIKNYNYKKVIIKDAPPRRVMSGRRNNNYDSTTKDEVRTNSKNDNSLAFKFNNDTNYNISYNEKNSFEEIFDEGNELNYNNNYITKNGEFMKNNYLEQKRKEMFNKIKTALKPINEDEHDNNNNFLDDDYDSYKKKKKNSLTSEPEVVIKNRLYNYFAGADIDMNIKIHRFKTYPFYENKFNKNENSRRISNFLFDEESDIEGNERLFQDRNSRDRGKNNNNLINNNYNESDISEEKKNNDNILILKHNKKKSVDLITESMSDSFDGNKNKYIHNRNKKNSKLYNNLKTENSDFFKEKLKRNFQYSINSENRKLKTSFLDISNCRAKFMPNKNNLHENQEEKNSNHENNNISSSTSLDTYVIDPSKNIYTFCNFYWNYFIRREIFLASFYNKDDNVAFFIRITTFIFVMSFIFTINCLLLTTKYIHNRYIYAKDNNKINEANYVFTKEFLKSLYCAIISIIFKMICIKVIYNKIFKISFKDKEELSLFDNRVLNVEENNLIVQRRENLIQNYRKKSLIYILIIIVLILLLGYISVNYIGIFINTKVGIILGFLLSIFLSFLFCAFICLMIVLIYYIVKKFQLQCFITFYCLFKKIY